MHLISIAGGPAVGFATLIESLFPPIASEAILPLAGFDVSRGMISLVEAALWATIGSMLGAWVVYALGRMIGKERMLELAKSTPGFSYSYAAKATAGFEKGATWFVLIGRFIPIVRSAVSLAAGVVRMNFLRFTNLTLLASVIWNAFLIVIGMSLGRQWCAVLQLVSVVELIVIIASIVLIVGIIAVWLRGWYAVRHASKGQ